MRVNLKIQNYKLAFSMLIRAGDSILTESALFLILNNKNF